MSSPPCLIEPNPDVTGTGIRISIYALALGGRLVQFIASQIGEEEDTRELNEAVTSALSVQGTALLFTAIMQAFQNKITLFHAVCVIHLLALLGINLPGRDRTKDPGPLRVYVWLGIKFCVSSIFVLFSAYIWIKAKTFGVQPECNADTIYVVFGISLNATSTALRWVMASTLIVTAVSTIVGALLMACGYAFFKYDSERHPHRWSIMQHQPQTPEGNEDEARVRQWMSAIITAGVNIYAIVSLEQTISRNTIGPGEEGWTFGQILAMFMLVGVVNEVINFILAHLDRQKQERRRRIE